MARRLALIAGSFVLALALVGCGSDDDSSDDSASETTVEGADEPSAGRDEDAAFCAAYDEFESSFQDLDSNTVADLEAGIETMRDGVSELREVAPEELTEALDLMAEAADDLADAVAGAEDIEAAQEAAGEVFSDEKYSGTNGVEDYYVENCPQANDEQAPAEEDGEG